MSASLISGEADSILVIIDKDVITQSELSNYIEVSKVFLGDFPFPNERIEEEFENERLESLIRFYILKNVEDSFPALQVSEEDLQAEFRRIYNDIAISMFGDSANEDSLSDFFKSKGLDWNFAKKLLGQEYKMNILLERYIVFNKPILSDPSDYNITDEQLKNFYDIIKDSLKLPVSYHFSRIILAPIPTDERLRQVNRKANIVMQALSEGEDFRSIARMYSEDTLSNRYGGYLGVVHRGEFLPEVEDLIFSIESGNMGVAQSFEGIHIVYVPVNWLDSAKVYQIFISIAPTHEDSVRVFEEIDEVMRRLDDGESFSNVAREFSHDPFTKDIGGDLGEVPAESLDISLQTVLSLLEPGEYTAPIPSMLGYMILKLDAVTLGEPPPFDEVKEELKQTYIFRERERFSENWIEELKKVVYIERRLTSE